MGFGLDSLNMITMTVVSKSIMLEILSARLTIIDPFSGYLGQNYKFIALLQPPFTCSLPKFLFLLSPPPPHWVVYVEQEGVDFIIKTS